MRSQAEFNVVRVSDKNEKFAELRDIRDGPSEMAKKYDNKLFISLQWGRGITGHLLFTPVMINSLAELFYLISFCLLLLFKTY